MTFIECKIITENIINLTVESEIFGKIILDKSRVFGQSSKKLVLGIRPGENSYSTKNCSIQRFSFWKNY